MHRAAHALAARATDALRGGARDGAPLSSTRRPTREIVFVRGTTEAINLVAQSLGRGQRQAGDEVVDHRLEHHSNIVPWQHAVRREGRAAARRRRSTTPASMMLDEYETLLDRRTARRLTHVSNALGTVTPVQRDRRDGASAAAPVLVDGAQAVSHMPVDVQALDCRLLRVLRPQDVRADRHRRAVRQARAARRDAAVAGRRQHDPDVTFEKTIYQRAAAASSRPAPATSPTRSGSARRSTMSTRRPRQDRAHEHDLLVYATERLDRARPAPRRHRRAKRPGCCRSCSTGIAPKSRRRARSEGIAVRRPSLRAADLHRFGWRDRAPVAGALQHGEDIDALVASLQALRGREGQAQDYSAARGHSLGGRDRKAFHHRRRRSERGAARLPFAAQRR